jgi:hypothetical protein
VVKVDNEAFGRVLKEGDILVETNDEPVGKPLAENLRSTATKASDSVCMTILRGKTLMYFAFAQKNPAPK